MQAHIPEERVLASGTALHGDVCGSCGQADQHGWQLLCLALWLSCCTSLSLHFLVWEMGMNNSNIARFFWRARKRHARPLAQCLERKVHTEEALGLFIISRHHGKMRKALAHLQIPERGAGDETCFIAIQGEPCYLEEGSSQRRMRKEATGDSHHESATAILFWGQCGWEGLRRRNRCRDRPPGVRWSQQGSTGQRDGRWWGCRVNSLDRAHWTEKGLACSAKSGF